MNKILIALIIAGSFVGISLAQNVQITYTDGPNGTFIKNIGISQSNATPTRVQQQCDILQNEANNCYNEILSAPKDFQQQAQAVATNVVAVTDSAAQAQVQAP